MEEGLLYTNQGAVPLHKTLAIGHGNTMDQAANSVADQGAAALREGPLVGGSAARTMAGVAALWVAKPGDRTRKYNYILPTLHVVVRL